MSKDYVYSELKQKIISGDLKPEQIVREEHLAALLEISRTPLREAIQRLEIEEFLIRQPNGRLKVASISKQEAKEIFQIRSMLEGFIARQAAINAKEIDIQNLTAMLEKLRQSFKLGHRQEFVSYGFEFHDYLSEMSHLKTFEKILNLLKDHALRYCRFVSTYGDWDVKADEEHSLILQNIADKNPDGAEKAMQEHILSSLSTAIQRIEEIENDRKE
jgi:DNA-binding GntR family transcriptional regulator